MNRAQLMRFMSANDNDERADIAKLADGQDSPAPSFGRTSSVKKPGPLQSTIMRIFTAVRAEIERGYNDV